MWDIIAKIATFVVEHSGVISSAIVGIAGLLGLRTSKRWSTIDGYVDQWWFLVEALGGSSGKKWTTLIKGLWDDFVDEFGREPTPKEVRHIRARVQKLCKSDKRCKNGVNEKTIPFWAASKAEVF